MCTPFLRGLFCCTQRSSVGSHYPTKTWASKIKFLVQEHNQENDEARFQTEFQKSVLSHCTCPSPPELMSFLFSGTWDVCFPTSAGPALVRWPPRGMNANNATTEGSSPEKAHIPRVSDILLGLVPLRIRLPFYNMRPTCLLLQSAQIPLSSWATGRQLQAPAWVRGQDEWQQGPPQHLADGSPLVPSSYRGSPAVGRPGRCRPSQLSFPWL